MIIFLYGQEFGPSATVIQIAVPGLVILASCMPFVAYFEGIGKANLVPKLQLIPIFFQALIGYFMINKYGLDGASLTLSLACLIWGITLLLAFKRESNLPSKLFMPQFADIIYIAKAIVSLLKKK